MDKHLTIRVPKRLIKATLVLALVAAVISPIAVSASHTFDDVPDTNLFHEDITWMSDAGVTAGCNPPANNNYCPKANVTREQMAAFMRRLAENQVVDAATAITADSATTAGNSNTVDGKHARDFVGTYGPLRVFAAATYEIGGAIRVSTGPILDADHLGAGEYRVNLSEAFLDPSPIVTITRLSTVGGSCSWSFNGTSNTQIDVSCHSPAGVSQDGLFSIVIFEVVPTRVTLDLPDAWHPSSGRTD